MRIKKAAEAKHEATKSPATAEFLHKALGGSLLDLLRILRGFSRPWSEPRGDLYHWIPLLNAFDFILAEFNSTYELKRGPQLQPFAHKLLHSGVQDQDLQINLRELGIDEQLDASDGDEDLVVEILNFSRLLLDNCANRTLYNSSDHIEPLLNSTSTAVVISALHLASRCAATYYRSNYNRASPRQGLNSALLQIHYRINPEHIQKLAEPFITHVERATELVLEVPQTPLGKSKEVGAPPGQETEKQIPKPHPSDLCALVQDVEHPPSHFREFGCVRFEVNAGLEKSTGASAAGDSEQNSPSLPTTPTPTRRASGPSRLSQNAVSDEPDDGEVPTENDKTFGRSRRTLVISAQEIESTDVTTLLQTYLPLLPTKELGFALLTRVRYAKGMLGDAASRQACVAIRILALENVAFLYPENAFSQKIVQQDSQLPRELQFVSQLTELIKPGEKRAPDELRVLALEAIEAINTKHKAKHNEICSALGVTVNHGVIFQLLREINQDLQSDGDLDMLKLEKHDRIFNLLDSLRNHSQGPASRSTRSLTLDALISAGLFTILVETLAIRSAKAQHAQNRTIVFVQEGSRQTRDGIRTFANASGLGALSDLISWEVNTCLDAVSSGKGISPKIKSKVMDYSVPVWHQQTLRTALKFVNYLLSQQTVHTERLLRNLIDSAHLLRAMKQIIANAEIFGSNIYANTISMVSTFIHNEPQSYSVIQESGISKGLLDSISSSRTDDASIASSIRRLPIKRSLEDDKILCGQDGDLETVSLSRATDEKLAPNILCSTDVLLNLPHSFGALCLTSQGLQLFLSSRALESYFEVFESAPHVRTIASEKDLATFIGNAFDELVRHHPDLRTAVLRCFILTLARLVHKCRTMKAADNAQIRRDKTVDAAQSPGASAATAQDVSMSDAPEGPDALNTVFGDHAEDAGVTAYITIFCRFLNGFFANQQMAASFLDNGGLPFALDLCTLPSLPFDFVHDPGFDASYDLTKTIHTLSEARPSQTIPVVLSHAQQALDRSLLLIDSDRCPAFLQTLLSDGLFDESYATELARSFLQTFVFLNVLQELLSHSVFQQHARDRSWSPLSTVNATEMWISVISKAGALSKFCTWQALSLFDDAPSTLELLTRLKGTGIGAEANKILGISTYPPVIQVTAPDKDHFQVAVPDSNGKFEPPVRFKRTFVMNCKIVRHMLTTMPNAVSAFFLNVGSKAVTAKKQRDYVRQNMFMLSEAVSRVMIEHLEYNVARDAQKPAHLKAYYIVVLDILRRILYVNDIDSGAASHFTTIFFLTLRSNGLIQWLSDLLLDASRTAVSNSEEAEKIPKPKETQSDIVNSARTVMRLTLILLGCFVSNKFYTESSQSTLLASQSSDTPNHTLTQFSFSPGLTLVEVRWSILQAVEPVWSIDGVENLASQPLRRIVRILRAILEADGEPNKTHRRKTDIPALQEATHKQCSIINAKLSQMASESKSAGNKWDHDLIIEALYRSNNDLETAREYAEARISLGYPRFPPPSYDLDLTSVKILETPSRRDSQSTIPDQGSDPNPQPRLTDDMTPIISELMTGSVESQHQETTSAVNTTAIDTASSNETDDDRRMAMSIDNVLTITEREQSHSDKPADAVTKSQGNGSVSTLDQPKPPIKVTLSSLRIAVEDLDVVRNPMRRSLITRVMDILSVHDTLTVDLSELLKTAAKTKDHDQAIQIKKEIGDSIIDVLLSYGLSGEIMESQKNIATCANLLARLMQDRDFYKACNDQLANTHTIDALLGFVKVFPDASQKGREDRYPWVGHVLLIFEKLLSEELRPEQITWHAPASDSIQKSTEPIVGYVDQIMGDDQRHGLFDSLVAVLPHIGRDRTLALSVVRVLAMLTRHTTIASKLSAKQNLQRLFLMVKQMAGLNIEALQTSFMLILRHISEDEDTIRRTMRNAIIESFVGYRGGDHSTHDTATYVRNHSASILRAPKVFLEVTDEVLEITKFDRDARSQVLALKKDAVPKTYSTWDSSGQQNKPSGSEDKLTTTMELIHTTETGEAASVATDKLRAEIKTPVVERPDGLVHFLLSQLLSYRTVEDNEATDKSPLEQPNGEQMNTSSGDDHDTELEPVSQNNRPQRDAITSKSDKREEWKPEDHPIHHFRVFLLQCLTELLMSYNQAKVEFINFSRKADPKAMTPSKPRSGVLNYLLNDLIPLNSLTRETNTVALKRQGTSTWAMSVVVALCLRTPETYRDGRDPTMEARDGDLLFVRKFIIEHAIKAYRDLQSANDLLPEVKYARMLSISDLFNRMMMGRVLPVHSSAAKQHGETEQRTEMHKTYIARIMYEKNLIGVLTASCAEIDLAVPNAKRAVKYILRPLKSLTFTAIEYSKESDVSTTPGQTTEEDEISTATSVSDISDVREETPDLARYSALGILEPSRGEDGESEESEDEDEEMYDDGYDEGMEYEDDIDHADDDEAVSDPDEDDEMGPIEGVNGDMIMNIEVVNSDGEEISEDEDDSDDDESDDEGDDDSDDDEDMDDADGEIAYEEIEGGDGGSLDDHSDSHEHEWREIDGIETGEDEDEGEDVDIGGSFPGLRGIANGESLGDDPFQAVLAGEAANFASLADDIENGRYMANMELVRDEDDEQLEGEDEEGDDLDDEEAEEEDEFMYETYDDDDDGPGWDMDEEFNIITGRTGRHHPHHHHGIEVHGGLRGAPFGRLELSDLPFMTRDGGPPGGIFPGHSAVRVHRNGSSGVPRGAADDGINPLLARTSDDQISDNSWRHATGVRTFHRGNGMPSFLQAIIGAPGDRGAASIVGGLMNAALPDIISRHGNWSTGGNIVFNAPISPEDMELLMGGGLDPRGTRFDPNTGTFTQRSFGNSRDDAAYVPQFTPLPTDARWQEEAKMLFPHHGNLLEQANTVTNSILRLLVPDAMEREKIRLERERIQKEAERREEEEKRKRREQEEKEKKEREEKERQEREQREREEDERRQREAAEALVQSVSAAASEEMEIDQIDQNQETSIDQPGTGLSTSDGIPVGQGDRVFTRIRDRLVDITELGIAADYIEALPEDMREEVVMGRVQEQRSQAVDAGQAPTELSQEFLNALPEDIREDIIQQDRSDRMRRERQEARRREQEVSGGAQAEDMNLGDFLATLDEDLRRTVLLEENFGSETISQLPPDIRRQAERIMNVFGTRHREPAPSHRYGYMGRAELALNPWDNNPNEAQARAKERRPIVQMLDKQGIHTVLRLLFVPQQGSLKESLNTIFENLAQNRQNRAELISLLLALLQEGSSDSSAIERSYASLSYRAKQRDAVQMTPKQLKRTLTGTGSTVSNMSSEVTPTMVLTQCLAALGHLSQFNPSVQGFFVNEHETSSTLKRKGKGKEKERENKAQKYAINALLSLLDKQMIMDNAGCMEHLSSLLQHVTHPLLILLRKEKEEKEREGKDENEAGDAAVVPTSATADQPRPVHTSTEPNDSEADHQNANEQSNAEKIHSENGNKETKEEGKKQRNLMPPVIPEQNLRLVINIITAKECNGKIFRDTIGIITNLSAVPGAKDIFGKELVKQAQELGTILAFDLTELLDQLKRDSQSTSVQTHVLSKFSIMSSEQTKLLRVLTALDYLFDAKRVTSPGASEAPDSSALKADLLSSLYDSPTFGPVWERLSDCLKAIRGKDNMTNIATILLPLVEALMVVCKNTSLKDSSGTLGKSQQFSVTSPEPESSMDTLFFRFTEDHRKILNDLVRNNPRLMSGTFALLVRNPKVLEFDNKRNYFTRRLQSRDETRRSHPSLQFNVRRKEVFTDSYRSLYYKSADEFKYGKLNVKFSGEEGVDAGGVTREWFQSISRQMFDPGYALFVPVASDRTTFHPDKRSSINPDHLSYFKFIGRIIGKAMFEGRPLDCHFSRAVYKRILGKTVSIKDMETLDLDYYKSLLWMLGNDITEVITETFSLEEEEFGVMRIIDLIPNGRNVPVTEENKHEFVQKVVEFRLTGSIQEQLNEFLVGFHQIVPANLVSIFNEQELELLISGLPEINIDDWKANTEYHNYNQGSAQIQWFWRAVRSFDKEERAKLMQFVTGTSKVPLNGFKELEGMNGFSKFNIHRDYGDKERLPSSHTCFNQLDLPEYDDYETLRARLYTAMTAGGEYFGFA